MAAAEARVVVASGKDVGEGDATVIEAYGVESLAEDVVEANVAKRAVATDIVVVIDAGLSNGFHARPRGERRPRRRTRVSASLSAVEQREPNLQAVQRGVPSLVSHKTSRNALIAFPLALRHTRAP